MTDRYKERREILNTELGQRYYSAGFVADKSMTIKTIHTVKHGDRLDKLSFKYYNTPTYWWVIAKANDIVDGSLYPEPGKKLLIPTI